MQGENAARAAMHGVLPNFATPLLARAIEALRPEQIDDLPFGVVGLDTDGTVRVYNKAEGDQSGYAGRPALGRAFFLDVAPCMNNGFFKGRIDQAMKKGRLDISFTFIGDFNDRHRPLEVRVQSAKNGGTWIFIDRPTLRKS